MAVSREHLISRTVQEILYVLLGRHTLEERRRILAEIQQKLGSR
jgi:hypothetical protein